MEDKAMQPPVVGKDAVKKDDKKVVDKPINVVATAKGFYNNERLSSGDKFVIKGESHFSENWMKKI